MKNTSRFILYFLLLFNIIHLIWLFSIPYGGTELLKKGIFWAVMINNDKFSNLSPFIYSAINISASILVFGSLILAVFLPLYKGLALIKKLRFMVILTLIPIATYIFMNW
jgi:hypothetical protein